LWGPADATLARAAELAWPAEVRVALDRLAAVLVAFTELADPPAPAVTIDLGDVRGFDYYTGVRFAGYAGGAPDAVLRGGRYDELIGRYGRAARATGFAIDVEAIAQAQRTIGIAAPATRLGLAVHGRGAAGFARALRAHGVRAVTSAAAPTASWLRGAGLDAAVLVETRELVASDGTRQALGAELDAVSIIQMLQGG
ncbi:MAG: ATP phosphoribosyltransferase regulatory subunit, partial [Deltaproteobacteria bacterium]|nr:ATP phosphoribosyltransferase regulatory subunit [Deltaproteobacteria bacterium]